MERLYVIENDYACIEIQKEIYPINVVKKALMNFTEELFIKLEINQDKIVIKILVKNNKKERLEGYIGEIYNELLRESTRYDISVETKNIRELIIGRALYSTCIDTSEDRESNNTENEYETKSYSLEEVATNWFDNYNKEEKEC